MEDSLVVEEGMLVKISLSPFGLLRLQLLLQGSFHQEEVKQHIVEIHKEPKS